MSDTRPLQPCKRSILPFTKSGACLEHHSPYSMETRLGGEGICTSVRFFSDPHPKPRCHTRSRGLFRYDRDHNTDHLYTRSACHLYLVGLSPKSDDGTKHLVGHQFVIGRIITGICPTFQSGLFNLERISLGLGNGLNTATVPSWQAECSKNRGLHICIEASMIAIGTVTAYWIVSVPY